MSDTVISASMRANLLSLQNINEMMDKTNRHLFTGKKVSSALDDPVAFFAAKALTDKANDLSKLLTSMDQNISGLKQASTGVESLGKLVDQANAIANQARDAMAKGAQEAKVVGTVDLKGVQDLSTKPGISTTSQLTFTVTDKDGTTVINAQNIGISANDSTEQLVTKINDLNASLSGPAIEAKINDAGKLEIKALDGGSLSLKFTGDTGTPTTAEDLAFAQALGFGDSAKPVANGTLTGAVQNYDVMINAKADSSLTSKALYSAANTLAKASDTLSALFNDASASTNLVTGTVDAADAIRVGVNGGTQKAYNISGLTVQGLVDKINTDFDGTLAASFDATTGQINIRSTDAKVQTVEFGVYDETTTNAMTTAFGFGIASSLTATAGGAGEHALNVESIRLGSAAADLATFESDYNAIRDQIDALVKDAGYNGTNLLNGDTLLTVFNEDRSTSITTKGKVLTSAGLGLGVANFGNAAAVDSSLTELRGATNSLRTFAASLASNLNTIQTRKDFTTNTITNLTEGSNKLTVADPTEEGATMLALQTRQQLAISAMTLTSQGEQAVLQMLR